MEYWSNSYTKLWWSLKELIMGDSETSSIQDFDNRLQMNNPTNTAIVAVFSITITLPLASLETLQIVRKKRLDSIFFIAKIFYESLGTKGLTHLKTTFPFYSPLNRENHFLYPLEMTENQRFSDLFRGYRKSFSDILGG